jgi:RNA polymerase sigma-70 factor (ECF subfamily)
MVSRAGQPHNIDDKQLVANAQNGDADAFGVLYARHMDTIYRYIFFRVHDQMVAEDLTEETFVRAWENLPKYKVTEHPVTSWLYRIAHNLVVDHTRKQPPITVSAIDILPQQAAEHKAEQAIEMSEEHAELINAMHILSEVEQQIIILRFVEGLSHREVAEITGKTEGSSRVIQCQALARLHEHLSKRL